MNQMWYLSFFVPLASLADAVGVASAVFSDPDTSGYFPVALLGPDGSEWRGGNAALLDSEIAALQGFGLIPGMVCYRWGIQDRTLEFAFPEGPATGSAWGWAEAVAGAGLTLPPPPDVT